MASDWLKSEAKLRREAARLLARMEKDPTPENRRALEQWRIRNERRAAIMRDEARVLVNARDLSTPANDQEPARTVAAVPLRKNIASAAMIAIAALVGAAAWLLQARRDTAIAAVMLTTDVGQIREFPLSDGSRVTLDTATAVRVELNAAKREAFVERGRARFVVARRSAPFIVHAVDLAMRTDDGILDAISSPIPSIHLIRGTAQVTDGAVAALAERTLRAPATLGTEQVGSSGHGDWTTGRLTFDRARLGDLVAAANRYSTAWIMVPDRNVAELRVSGMFRMGDNKALANTLAAAFALQVTADPNGNLILTTKTADGRSRMR